MGLRFALVLFLGLAFAPGAWAEGGGDTLGEAEPNREPTKIGLVVKLPEEVRAKLTPAQRSLLVEIEARLAREVFLYSNFDIEVPRPNLADGAQLLDLQPYFLVDAAGHVKRVAYDDKGNRRPLTAEQLEQFRVESKYAVEDPQNPGQFDVWQVTSSLAHKGSKQITIDLQKSLAKGLEHVLVQFPQELWGDDKKSVLAKVSNVLYGIRNSISLLIGLTEEDPKYSAHEVEQLVGQDRNAWVHDKMRFEGDARFVDEKVLEKVLPVITRLWDEAEREWPALIQRTRVALEISPAYVGMKVGDRPQYLVNQLALAKQELFFNKIIQSPEIEAAGRTVEGKPLGIALVKHAKALVILEATKRKLAADVLAHRNTLELHEQQESPIASRVPAWFRATVDAQTEEYYQQIMPTRLGMAADAMANMGLAEEAQRLRHSLIYAQTREQEVREELAAMKKPSRKFEHFVRIWSAKNWIRRQVTLADGTQRWEAVTVQKLPDVYTDTVGWRLFNYGLRSWSLFWNGTRTIGYDNLWNGALGFRSLFSWNPFPTVFLVNPETGAIEADDSYHPRPTLVSRLAATQASISKARADFEASADTGMIPKAAWRPLHIFWHRWVRQILQPLGIVALQGGGTLLNASVSVPLLATAPLWAVGLPTGLGGAVNAGLWDFDAPRKSLVGNGMDAPKDTGKLGPLWDQLLVRSGLRGIVPATLVGLKAVALDAVLQPLRYFVGGGTQYVAESVRDWAVRGFLWFVGANRVPAADPDRLVKRVQGPGVSGSYFYQLSPRDAFNAIRLQMELAQLAAYEAEVSRLLKLPIDELQSFFAPVMLLAGMDFVVHDQSPAGEKVYAFYVQKKKELEKAVAARRQELARLLPNRQAPVRMSQDDLEFVVAYGAQTSEAYLETAVLSELDRPQVEAFWNARNLTAGDWIGLSKGMLAEAFGKEVLVPMEAVDSGFKVAVKPNGVFETAEDLYRGGNGFPDPRSLPEWSAQAPVNPSVSIPTAGPSMFCPTMLARYGENLRTAKDLLND